MNSSLLAIQVSSPDLQRADPQSQYWAVRDYLSPVRLATPDATATHTVTHRPTRSHKLTQTRFSVNPNSRSMDESLLVSLQSYILELTEQRSLLRRATF